MESLLQSFIPMGHDNAEMHYRDIYQTERVEPHKAKFSHEAIAGAAGFAAMHAYEAHLRATGQQPTHTLMKEILAGIAAAEVDKLVETKGMDWIDRHHAKKMAARQAHELAERRYEGGTGWEYAQSMQGAPAMAYNYGGGTPYMAPGYGYPPPGGYGGYGQPQGGYGQPQGGYGQPQGGYGQPQSGYGYQQPPPGGYYAPPPPQGYYPQEGYAGEGEHHHHHHHHHHGGD